MSASTESKTPTPEPLADERVARWRTTADLDARAGQPVGAALREAAAEVERLRAELAETRQAYRGEVDRLRVDMGAVIAENNRLAGAATQLEAEVNVLRTEQGAVLRSLRDALGTSPATLGQAAVHAVKAVAERDHLAEQLKGDRLRKVIEATLVAYWALDRERETDKADVANAGSHAFTIVEALRIAGLPVEGESIGVRDRVRDAVLALGGTEAIR